jgi:hypothetical protein
MTTNNIEVRNIVRPIIFIAIGIVIGVVIAVTTIVPRRSNIGSVRGANRQAVGRAHTSTEVASRVFRRTGVLRVAVRDVETLGRVELGVGDADSLKVVEGCLV